MLIRFSVENFLSFKNKTELSLIPSKVRRHGNHVVKAEKRTDFDILRAAVIYGANASGKSNLIKAMSFAKNLVESGVKVGKTIACKPFKLDLETEKSPSRFEFEIKCGERNYAYGFIVDEKSIHEEWLYIINKNSDREVFTRKLTGDQHSFSFKGISFNTKDDESFLNFTAKGTPHNRLFINECKERNVFNELGYIEYISDVYRWFGRLNIVFPESKYAGLEVAVQDDKSGEKISHILRCFDTGISEVVLKEVDFKSGIPDVPDHIKEAIVEDLDENTDVVLAGPGNMRYKIGIDKNGNVIAFKLMAKHVNSIGDSKFFDINEESDGTQRLLDIANGLVEVFSEDVVYVIDELDRSVHPDITTSIINAFLNKSSGRSQMIVTTHESNLLNQDIVRKDEVWFTQKLSDGSTSLYSLEEYKPRFDKDIRRGYLAGRFGGVPIFPNTEALSWLTKDA